MKYWRAVGMIGLLGVVAWAKLELSSTALISVSFLALTGPIILTVFLNALDQLKGQRKPHKYTECQLKMLALIPQKLEERKPLEYTRWKDRKVK